LGLGLSIVRHLVELHGGTVFAKSPGEGGGATFVVHLPVKAVHLQTQDGGERVHPQEAVREPALVHESELKGLKVLVVDDEADARDLLKRVLEDCGAQVECADGAQAAVEAVAAHRPHVLVSDIGMPGTDGYELLRQVRMLGAGQGGNVPAIALTAFARSEDRVRALRAGFAVHVAKPVEPSEIIATVASVAAREAPG
jgi:CheY-like chemotaxis protein